MYRPVLPNNAFQPTPSRCALGFPRPLRGLGAAERGSVSRESHVEH
jgi:hypothetical protein